MQYDGTGQQHRMDVVKPGAPHEKIRLSSVRWHVNGPFCRAFDGFGAHFGHIERFYAEVRRPVARTIRLLPMGQEIVVAFLSSCNCRAVGGNRRSGARLLNQIDN